MPDTKGTSLRSTFMITEADQAGLKEIASLAASHRLRVRIDTVLPLEQATKAHEIGETGRTA
ncbi:zinc-binding dehydrogenase [Streptomyces sp. CB00455]|uniref:zinc-binding dehydrogenase n=1 Tax=Streptomyces sp. CB00455 TaxID=1703927 RepID=UPI000ADB04C1|nr:zinc-binding dehydrogenase [Streptomyces sp. CB00455]